MLNDHSSALRSLKPAVRASPANWSGPGPTAGGIERILTIAVRTPDHGKLAPWRFVIVGQDQRQELADLLPRALPEHDPDARRRNIRRTRIRPPGAVMIVLISAPVQDHKIPVWEQQLSCGAVGMNLLQAAHALGYVGGWITGWQAYSPRVTRPFARKANGSRGSFSSGRPATGGAPAPCPATMFRQWQPPELKSLRH